MTTRRGRLKPYMYNYLLINHMLEGGVVGVIQFKAPLTLVMRNAAANIFRHFGQEFLTQFPASNDEK